MRFQRRQDVFGGVGGVGITACIVYRGGVLGGGAGKGMGAKRAEGGEPFAGGGVWIRDVAGGARFFAGDEVMSIRGVGVVDAGEFAGNGDGNNFAGLDFLLVEDVVGDDGGGKCAGEWEVEG